jgi:hypothetical protein
VTGSGFRAAAGRLAAEHDLDRARLVIFTAVLDVGDELADLVDGPTARAVAVVNKRAARSQRAARRIGAPVRPTSAVEFHRPRSALERQHCDAAAGSRDGIELLGALVGRH